MATSVDLKPNIDGQSKEFSISLSEQQMSAWRADFYDSPQNRMAQNMCTALGPIQVGLNHAAVLSSLASGVKKWQTIKAPGKATTGGPGWICTGLDMLRLGMDQSIPMPVDFELSAGHLLFYHKLEECNYFLRKVCELLESREPLDGHLFQHLMKNAVSDYGNFHMFLNLVKKYGIMPRSCYLTSTPTCISNANKLLKSKLHEYSSRLNAQFTLDGDGRNLPDLITNDMLPSLYKVLAICMREPSVEFTWTFYDQKKRYQSLEKLNSVHLYEVLMERGTINLDSCVCLAHDPRPTSSYDTNYKVSLRSNMVGAKDHIYNNQPMDVIMQIIEKALVGGSSVWLGCDLRHRLKIMPSVISLETYKFDLVFGVEVGNTLTKPERLTYLDSRPDTTLLLTGLGFNSSMQAIKFSTISNLGRTTTANNKSMVLDAEWLREYGFQIVVDEKFVPQNVMDAVKNPDFKTLPPWDPMGALYS